MKIKIASLARHQSNSFTNSAIAALCALSFGLGGCSHEPPKGPGPSLPGVAASAEGGKLAQIVATYTNSAKRLDAFAAPFFNVEEDLGKFGDYPAPEFFERSKQLYRTSLESLKSVNFEALNADEKRLYRLFKEDLEVAMADFDYPQELLAFNQMDNRLHAYLDDSSKELTSFPFDSVKHYDDFVSRGQGFPDYVDRQIDLLRRGLRQKIVLSCDVVTQVPNSYKDGMETDVEKNPFFRPVGFMPPGFSAADRARLTDSFRKMVAEKIIPGFQKFDAFFKTEYAPHCRKGYGLAGLPHAKDWYAHSIRSATNVTMPAKAIHALGISEVNRLEKEMTEIKKQLGFKGTNQAFRKSLTRDPRYFFKSSDDIFKAMEKVKAETATKLPKYFSLVPKADYKIVASSNPEDAAGSYFDPTELVPYGKFIINVKNLRAVPIYGVTTLSLHETAPGHHFQLALQFEMKDKLSEYQRKMFHSNAFVEGWALYAEHLGDEMGMYSDPMQRLGNRNDEMLRAVRLVVDTGIHDLGWDRKKAIAYMTDHLASDAGDISNEANRYSVWPGQALGYKIGSLKIIELRKLAEKELGDKFDIKEFHRVVIGNGTVSLGVLETQVKEWIASLKKI